MLERLISEIKDKHNKRPISQEAYNRWRHSAVTIRLFEELELAVIDSYQNYVTENNNTDEILIEVGKRDGYAQMVEQVIDWSPAGVEGPNDED